MRNSYEGSSRPIGGRTEQASAPSEAPNGAGPEAQAENSPQSRLSMESMLEVRKNIGDLYQQGVYTSEAIKEEDPIAQESLREQAKLQDSYDFILSEAQYLHENAQNQNSAIIGGRKNNEITSLDLFPKAPRPREQDFESSRQGYLKLREDERHSAEVSRADSDIVSPQDLANALLGQEPSEDHGRVFRSGIRKGEYKAADRAYDSYGNPSPFSANKLAELKLIDLAYQEEAKDSDGQPAGLSNMETRKSYCESMLDDYKAGLSRLTTDGKMILDLYSHPEQFYKEGGGSPEHQKALLEALTHNAKLVFDYVASIRKIKQFQEDPRFKSLAEIESQEPAELGPNYRHLLSALSDELKVDKKSGKISASPYLEAILACGAPESVPEDTNEASTLDKLISFINNRVDRDCEDYDTNAELIMPSFFEGFSERQKAKVINSLLNQSGAEIAPNYLPDDKALPDASKLVGNKDKALARTKEKLKKACLDLYAHSPNEDPAQCGFSEGISYIENLKQDGDYGEGDLINLTGSGLAKKIHSAYLRRKIHGVGQVIEGMLTSSEGTDKAPLETLCSNEHEILRTLGLRRLEIGELGGGCALPVERRNFKNVKQPDGSITRVIEKSTSARSFSQIKPAEVQYSIDYLKDQFDLDPFDPKVASSAIKGVVRTLKAHQYLAAQENKAGEKPIRYIRLAIKTFGLDRSPILYNELMTEITNQARDDAEAETLKKLLAGDNILLSLDGSGSENEGRRGTSWALSLLNKELIDRITKTDAEDFEPNENEKILPIDPIVPREHVVKNILHAAFPAIKAIGYDSAVNSVTGAVNALTGNHAQEIECRRLISNDLKSPDLDKTSSTLLGASFLIPDPENPNLYRGVGSFYENIAEVGAAYAANISFDHALTKEEAIKKQNEQIAALKEARPEQNSEKPMAKNGKIKTDINGHNIARFNHRNVDFFASRSASEAAAAMLCYAVTGQSINNINDKNNPYATSTNGGSNYAQEIRRMVEDAINKSIDSMSPLNESGLRYPRTDAPDEVIKKLSEKIEIV